MVRSRIGVKTEGALEIDCISARAPPRVHGILFVTHKLSTYTRDHPSTKHVRALISAELDHATLHAQGWVGGKFLWTRCCRVPFWVVESFALSEARVSACILSRIFIGLFRIVFARMKALW